MCGLCTEMCSLSELIMRQKNALIHPLETDNPWGVSSKVLCTTRASKSSLRQKQSELVANPDKVVKAYSRSAADKKILVENVRPFKVLNTTVDYLLKQ